MSADEPNCMDRASTQCCCCCTCIMATTPIMPLYTVYGACQCGVSKQLYPLNAEQKKRDHVVDLTLLPGRWNSESCVPWYVGDHACSLVPAFWGRNVGSLIHPYRCYRPCKRAVSWSTRYCCCQRNHASQAAPQTQNMS